MKHINIYLSKHKRDVQLHKLYKLEEKLLQAIRDNASDYKIKVLESNIHFLKACLYRHK